MQFVHRHSTIQPFTHLCIQSTLINALVKWRREGNNECFFVCLPFTEPTAAKNSNQINLFDFYRTWQKAYWLMVAEETKIKINQTSNINIWHYIGTFSHMSPTHVCFSLILMKNISPFNHRYSASLLIILISKIHFVLLK